jgi:sulfate transport system ATP-binding protein
LLLDEPFGALDAKIRKELRAWLRQLHEKIPVTTVFVTHDQEEAMEVADQIVVMNEGKVEQIGTPAEIYESPASPFVMSFIGEVNVLPSHARLFRDTLVNPVQHPVFVRPHDIEILTNSTESATEAKVERLINFGWEVQAELLDIDGLPLRVHLTRDKFEQLNLKRGQRVFIQPKDTKLFVNSAI